ncbi:MAG: tetratricopeptide repeat protein, partial [Marinirhabdus sp.]
MSKNLMATALLFISFLSFSQQTASYTDHLVEYNKALELYNNNQFLAAQNLFSRVRATAQTQTIQADCAYYIANCAVRLNQQGADALIENFVKEHPTSVKKNEAYINVASYYFENGKYSRAQKYYAKLDPKAIPRKERDRFNFNNGYVYFKAKNSDQAKKYFNRVTTSKEYGAQAKYYLGFMAYEGDDYEAATQLFEEVKDEARYTEGLSYYQADMNFKLGNFQKAITLGSAQYERSNPRERSELAKIIGEGHFNLGNYAKAIPYLKEYKGKRGKWNNTDHYLLGYAHYKQGAYQEAINQFNKIIGGKNSVAQNAYYHLAESYLKLDQKQQALNAFKNASEMDFSLKIQEDASLNYAKLSYEIGNSYTAVPHVLLSFIETYPNNPQTENLKALLVGSYISSKNYKGAIQLLEKNTGYRDAATYQKVTFLRGIELYGQGNYERAIAHFDKSIENPEDKTYSARATFWKAESNYQRSHFEASLTGYNQFLKMAAAQQTPEYQNTAYNIAYNNFKLKKYNEAINGFKTYLQSATPNGARKTDSYLRLGDSYYVTSRYWPAMENYGKAIAAKNPGADYAAFQRATSYGFVDRNANKIKELEKFAGQYPKSIYRDDAWYELGNT